MFTFYYPSRSLVEILGTLLGLAIAAATPSSRVNEQHTVVRGRSLYHPRRSDPPALQTDGSHLQAAAVAY